MVITFERATNIDPCPVRLPGRGQGAGLVLGYSNTAVGVGDGAGMRCIQHMAVSLISSVREERQLCEAARR